MSRLHSAPIRCTHPHCSRRHGTAYSSSRAPVYMGSCGRHESREVRSTWRTDWPWILALVVVMAAALFCGETLK